MAERESEDVHAMALAFATYCLADGDDEASVKARIRLYAAERAAGRSHEQILGLPEPPDG